MDEESEPKSISYNNSQDLSNTSCIVQSNLHSFIHSTSYLMNTHYMLVTKHHRFISEEESRSLHCSGERQTKTKMNNIVNEMDKNTKVDRDPVHTTDY